MKLPSSILMLLLLGWAVPTPAIDIFRVSETVRLTGTNELHTAKLTVTTEEFQSARHRIKRHRLPQSRVDGVADFVTLIDGRRPLGTNDALPTTEIRSMIVSFEGRSLVVPKRFFSDCYNPNFSQENLGTKLSDNGQSLLVFMAAGQGKGRYQLMWILRADGQHARFFSRCEECEQKDILNFFRRK